MTVVKLNHDNLRRILAQDCAPLTHRVADQVGATAAGLTSRPVTVRKGDRAQTRARAMVAGPASAVTAAAQAAGLSLRTR